MPDDHFLAEEAAGFLPAPPTDTAGRRDWLRLTRSRRVGPATFRRLMLEHGSAPAALAALPEVARAAGVEGYTPCSIADAEAEMQAAEKAGARLLCLGAADFPAELAKMPDAPPILWAIGDISLATRPGVALVGARNASALGQRMARRLAAGLGELGFVIVSGLARGIDAAAHGAALDSGTIAVMAGGLDVIYPSENAKLAKNIAQNGLCVSEIPFGLHPQARHFPQRNRIVAGISLAVVVVEGAARSGSLITARNALDQGREVMAVPGSPLDARSAGCNMLIRDGAMLVRSATDVAEALGEVGRKSQPGTEKPADNVTPSLPMNEPLPEQPPDTSLSTRLLALLAAAPIAEDALIRELRAQPADVSHALLECELRGEIERHPGGMISRSVSG